MEQEIWKEIEGYDGMYGISNFGRVKSYKKGKEIILKNVVNNDKYYIIGLHKNCKCYTIKIHKLVAIYFLNHKMNGYKSVIDHIDGNKQNNVVSNLQIVSMRDNVAKCYHPSRNKHTSKYTGVCWHKASNKWSSQIYLNKKKKYLGLFESEIEAYNAYLKALNYDL